MFRTAISPTKGPYIHVPLPRVSPGHRTNNLPQVQTLLPLATDHTSLVEGNFTFEGPSAGARDKRDNYDLVPLPMNNLYNLTNPNNSQLIRVDPADVNGTSSARVS